MIPNARERLDQFHPQVSTDRPRRPCQRSERHRLVLGIEQPIKLSPARFHARRELGLGDLLTPHQLIKLPHQNTLDRPRGDHFVGPIFLQEIVEGRSDLPALLSGARFLHSISFLRLIANSRSPAGVFCVFLTKAWSKTILAGVLTEQHLSDTALRQRAANLPQSSAQRTAQRHANGPNSTSLIFLPMIPRSSADKPFSHSRTGSRPDDKASKQAGNCFIGRADAKTKSIVLLAARQRTCRVSSGDLPRGFGRVSSKT